jgi:hypothetical protein
MAHGSCIALVRLSTSTTFSFIVALGCPSRTLRTYTKVDLIDRAYILCSDWCVVGWFL